MTIPKMCFPELQRWRTSKQKLASKPLTHIILLTLIVYTGAGCSDGNRDLPGDQLVLFDLLPSSTRGFLMLSAPGDAEIQRPALPLSNPPPRHIPGDLLDFYTSGTSIPDRARELIFAQTSENGSDYVLIAKLDAPALDAEIDHLRTMADESEFTTYRDVSLYVIPSRQQQFTQIGPGTLITGSARGVASVIDRFKGITDGIRESPIAPFIAEDPYQFGAYAVYGMPALYRHVSNPGTGQHSLNGAFALSIASNSAGDWAKGVVNIFADNALSYGQRLTELLPEVFEPTLAGSADTLTLNLADMPGLESWQAVVKTLVPGMNAVDYAESVSQDGNPPWLNFLVGGAPNSIFINFEFSDAEQRLRFEREHLPDGFRLARLPIVAGETPRYFLVLNIYQSSGGLVEGARAEWSVFVRDPATSEPRFLVVEAAAENISADSVNGLTPPEPVSHSLTENAIVSYVGLLIGETNAEIPYFLSSIRWPPTTEVLTAFDSVFVAANDYIYWGNAVADRGLYNASVHNRSAVLIDNEALEIEDDSIWASYIDPEPVHTLVYRNPLDIVISPWWNLEADYLDMTEAYRQELIAFKNGFYPGTALSLAEDGVRSGALPPVAGITGQQQPATYYHFLLERPHALLGDIGGASRLSPARVRPGTGEALDYYLTLAINTEPERTCGSSAYWQTYVSSDTARIETLVLDSMTSDVCTDAAGLLSLPVSIRHTAGEKLLQTQISSPLVNIELRATTTSGVYVEPDPDWVETNDRYCEINNVCSHRHYDGATLRQPLLRLAQDSFQVVTIKSPWDAYISEQPAITTIRESSALQAVSHWINVPALTAQ